MQTDELWLARKHVWKYTADFNGFQKRHKKKEKNNNHKRLKYIVYKTEKYNS